MAINYICHPRMLLSGVQKWRLVWIPACLPAGRLFAGMTILFSSFAHATPPTQIDLTYDLDKGNLHVEAKHPTDNLNKHYLRRLVVYKNNDQEQEFSYIRQTSPSKLVQDVPIIAKPGDVLAVEAFCKEGGSKREELIVSDPVPAAPKPNEKPATPSKNTY